jgi:hypothetical protein
VGEEEDTYLRRPSNPLERRAAHEQQATRVPTVLNPSPGRALEERLREGGDGKVSPLVSRGLHAALKEG